jgi:uncharacterized membrane protein
MSAYAASAYVMAAIGGFGVVLFGVMLTLAVFGIIVVVLSYFSGARDGEAETRSEP